MFSKAKRLAVVVAGIAAVSGGGRRIPGGLMTDFLSASRDVHSGTTRRSHADLAACAYLSGATYCSGVINREGRSTP